MVRHNIALYPHSEHLFLCFFHAKNCSCVMQAAIEKAVKPSVATCIARLAAMESNTAEKISQLRRRVNDIVASLCCNNDKRSDNNNMQRTANKLLHVPTMQLREGTLLSQEGIEDVVKEIEMQLIEQSSEH